MRKEFALKDTAALGKEADRIAELCKAFVRSSVPPKP